MYVGKIKGTPVYIAKEAPNYSAICLGISGTGKTCRMHQIELMEVEKGGTVIVLDLHQTHGTNQIFNPISAKYEQLVNRIYVLEDGLDFDFLKMDTDENLEFVRTVNSAVSALSAPFSLGARQITALREAAIFGVINRTKFTDSLTAVVAGLHSQKLDSAKSVAEKLWPLHQLQVFQGKKKIQQNRINIICFDGIDIMTQILLSEIILSFLWRRAVAFGQNLQSDILIALDEFQNLSLRRESTLHAMLCEGRKYHIRLLMATQSIEIFKKDEKIALQQIGTKLYFQPDNNEAGKIAKQICREEPQKYIELLQSLKIGQSLEVGTVTVNGTVIRKAIILE